MCGNLGVDNVDLIKSPERLVEKGKRNSGKRPDREKLRKIKKEKKEKNKKNTAELKKKTDAASK